MTMNDAETPQPGLQKTLALIKPDASAAGPASEITQLIEMRGFTIIEKSKLKLTEKRAQEFYAEHEGKPFFSKLVSFMTSGPMWALVLAKRDAIQEWRAFMGPTNSEKARAEAPKTIRAIYGTDGTRNAVHGSDSPASAAREIKFFFPKLFLEPVPDKEAAQEYIIDKLQPTLIKALTALAKERPTSDRYEAITFLGRYLLENNPNKAKVVQDGSKAVLDVEEDNEEEFAGRIAINAPLPTQAPAASTAADGTAPAAPGEPLEMESTQEEMDAAATKVQACFRGHQARKQVQEMRDEAATTVPEPEEVVAKEPEDPRDDEHQAATTVQAAFRGHQARKEVQAKKEATAGEAPEDAPEAVEEAAGEAAATDAQQPEGEAEATDDAQPSEEEALPRAEAEAEAEAEADAEAEAEADAGAEPPAPAAAEEEAVAEAVAEEPAADAAAEEEPAAEAAAEAAAETEPAPTDDA